MSVDYVISRISRLGFLARRTALGPRKSSSVPLPMSELLANRGLMHGANHFYATDRHRYCGRSFLAGPKGGFGDAIHGRGALA
jgi:hypothetical protein